MLEVIKKLFNKQSKGRNSKADRNYEKNLFFKYGKCVERRKLNLKLLFIADTHDCLYYEKETLEYIKTQFH